MNYQIKAQEMKEKEAMKYLKDLEKKNNRSKLLELFRCQSEAFGNTHFSEIDPKNIAVDKESLVQNY